MKKGNLSHLVAWASVGFALVVFVILGLFGGFRATASSGGPFGLITYYVQQFGLSLFECMGQLILMFCLFVIFLAFYGIMRRFIFMFLESINVHVSSKFDLPDSPWKVVRGAAKKLGDVLIDVFPAMVLLLVVSIVFGEANGLDKTRLTDLSVIGSEHFLTGTYAFAWLGSFHWPHPIIEFIAGCFLNVAPIVILPSLFVGYVTPRVFREMITAFAIGMSVLMLCWLAIPALSPQDRFIDDVYKLPVPSGLAVVVANYHPQVEIQDFLASVRTQKEKLANLPTSTIPSAHIFWLGLAAYYFFKSKRWLGWAALPFILASSLGTVLFAQHYLLDVLASLLVVAVSIGVARKLVTSS